MGIQIFYILKEEVFFPIDYSCIIVYLFISAIEFITSIYAMITIGNRQSALFKLRNSPVSNQNKKESDLLLQRQNTLMESLIRSKFT